jgi:hypothetical protein
MAEAVRLPAAADNRSAEQQSHEGKVVINMEKYEEICGEGGNGGSVVR